MRRLNRRYENSDEEGAEDVSEDQTDREYLIAEQKNFPGEDYFAQGQSSAAIAPLLVVLAAIAGIVYYFVFRPGKGDWKPKPSPGQGVAAPTILISIDGFSHDFLRRRKDASDDSSPMLAPNLYAIATRGVCAVDGMQPVMPTKTWPNHWSMATGLYPEKTGIVGDTMYNPTSEKWFHLSRNEPEWWYGSPIWYTLRTSPRVVFDENWQHLKIDEEYTTATVFWPGSEVKEFAANVFSSFNQSVSIDDRVSRVVSLLKGSSSDLKRPAHFLTLYFESIELTCERHGPNSAEVSVEITKIDNAIGSLMERLGGETYNIIVVSDHGMTDVSTAQTVNLKPRIKDRTAQDISVSPFGLFANVSVSAADLFEDIQKALEKNRDGFTVYRKEDIPERWHLRESRLIPPVVTIAKKGWTLEYPHQNLVPHAGKAAESAEMTQEKVNGQSGFDNTLSDMQALFIAQGPAFREQAQVKNMRAVDLYEMLCYIFAVEPAPNNGSLETTLSSILNYV